MSIAAGSIDVRGLPARVRLPLIVGALDALSAGEAFELVLGEDPRALYLHLARHRAGCFEWHDVDDGPASWRVRLSRAGPRRAAGATA